MNFTALLTETSTGCNIVLYNNDITKTCWKQLFQNKIIPTLKEVTKFYFMHYSHVVFILLGTGLYKSAFSTYSFRKRGFRLSVFFVFFWSVLCFEFDVICKD